MDIILAFAGILAVNAAYCRCFWPFRRKAWRHYGTHRVASCLIGLGVLLQSSGCMNLPKTVKAMGESNASISVDIRTVYGTARIVRLNPGTNTLAHTVGKDGELTVSAQK